jgi:beta-phosphoglucomutase-like phosphatase (HAD superfamily)
VALRAIVFDFDGVLANSEPLHFAAFRDVLATSGLTLTEHDYYARYLGFDDVGVFRAVGADRGTTWSARDVAGFVADKALRLQELERDIPVLFPGAADAIRRSAACFPIAIASGALGPEIRRVLMRAGVLEHFSAIVSAEDTPASKPAPDPYVRAVALLAEKMSPPLHPHECVAIEDSRWGLDSAREAGLRTVGVTTSYDASELQPGADLIIPTIAALDVGDLQRLLFS